MSANNKRLSPYQGTELFSKFLSNYQSLLIALQNWNVSEKQFQCFNQCDQIWRISLFGKDYKSLTNFWRFITYLAKSWA